jgi:hypothetical protein
LQVHVRKNFTWDVIVGRLQDLYRPILARQSIGLTIK